MNFDVTDMRQLHRKTYLLDLKSKKNEHKIQNKPLFPFIFFSAFCLSSVLLDSISFTADFVISLSACLNSGTTIFTNSSSESLSLFSATFLKSTTVLPSVSEVS